MGCDIHAAIELNHGDGWNAVQFKNPLHGRWEDEPAQSASLHFGRNYCAFAILANVRNGYGFAGADTGDGFVPIAEPRGLPEDISDAARDACSGDHSDSYIYFDEMLAYDWTRETTRRGWINGDVFADWERSRTWEPRPTEWSGGVSGGLVEHVTEDEMRRRFLAAIDGLSSHARIRAVENFRRDAINTYCQVSWQESYTRAAGELWEKWFPIMLKLSHEGQVRLVMNFDS